MTRQLFATLLTFTFILTFSQQGNWTVVDGLATDTFGQGSAPSTVTFGNVRSTISMGSSIGALNQGIFSMLAGMEGNSSVAAPNHRRFGSTNFWFSIAFQPTGILPGQTFTKQVTILEDARLLDYYALAGGSLGPVTFHCDFAANGFRTEWFPGIGGLNDRRFLEQQRRITYNVTFTKINPITWIGNVTHIRPFDYAQGWRTALGNTVGLSTSGSEGGPAEEMTIISVESVQ